MTDMTKTQIDEGRNAVAVLRALHVRKDEALAQEVINGVEDWPAFVRGLQAVACASFRALDQIDTMVGSGVTGASILNHLSANLAAEDGA